MPNGQKLREFFQFCRRELTCNQGVSLEFSKERANLLMIRYPYHLLRIGGEVKGIRGKLLKEHVEIEFLKNTMSIIFFSIQVKSDEKR